MGRVCRENVNVPVIIQSVGGDLRLRGRGEGDLIVDGDGIHVEQIGEGQPFLVRAEGDCRITVPHDVAVVVQNVGGDAKITDLGGDTEIGAVGGDLTLRGVQGVVIKSAGGDLRLKWASGDVVVKAVGGDATIREVGGNLGVDAIGADLYIRNVEGSCVVQSVGSDLVLNIDFLPEREYQFSAGGDILCRVQPDTNARFVVPADLPVGLDVAADVSESDDGHQQIITLGDGRATITIGDGTELRLVSEEEDYVLDLGSQIEEELEARLSTIEEKISQQLEGLDERLQATAEHMASRAEQLAERAQRQAARAAERLRDRGSKSKAKRGPRIGFTWQTSPAPPAPPARPARPVDPVSEQERLMILKMVQDKKISIEEAERLLAALDS
ncbi:MAG: hypothetical protein JW910_22390 [Anaerolineae bacterium]|nr:hypothetical protein [Anaerolineae bacterium]